MKMMINDQEVPLPLNRKLSSALAQYGLQGKIFAVAVNGKCVPRSQWDNAPLSPNDVIQIVIPMQGG